MEDKIASIKNQQQKQHRKNLFNEKLNLNIVNSFGLFV